MDSSNNKPLISLYLVNYNYGKYIEESIRSVLNQSYQNFELIIIDDGSEDNSYEIIQQYKSNSKVLTIFQKNKGLVRTNNVALSVARGKYIMRLDADDYLDPKALEKMCEKLEQETDAVLVFPDYFIIDEHGEIVHQYQRFDFKSEELLLEKPAHGAVTMIRTDFLRSVGGYDEDFSCQDGYDLWLKVFKNHKVLNISEPLFYYRQHGSNLTKNQRHLYHTRAEMMSKYVDQNEIEELQVCAIIPVRGSAVDPRSKPFLKVGEKTLIEWTIDEALSAPQIKNVLVTTPDDSLINFLQERYQDKILYHKREVSKAKINSDIMSTLKDANEYLMQLNKNFDALMLLYIEYPFRCQRYIEKAINHMRIYEVDAVESVIEDNSIFYKHDGKGLKPLNPDSYLRLERDDIFKRSGGIHLLKPSIVSKSKSSLDLKTGHIVIDEEASFQVRTQLDIKLANFLAAEREKQ
ncbi:MAG: glycosyltransferase [Bdellovibrionales bacterium]|nr:glycosyltransferase [Bdellovibrionales bacterium]